ncbi:hypothetical protein OEZ71_01895 [Defluviimonas sp. WL0050]|uniref:Lipoprotein n=1 Tax=Albidovulum litorale TaxID=2984134 RepID=A0ABT2ZIS5_9RHOB|nr:hypothetical protein [Defluviimonas sp. WL0050]MCV2871040.1 hypothetical protein [Defluviimonas sp. WL0050]
MRYFAVLGIASLLSSGCVNDQSTGNSYRAYPAKMRPIVERLHTAFEDADTKTNCTPEEREFVVTSATLMAFADGDTHLEPGWRRGYESILENLKQRWEELGGDTRSVSDGCVKAVQRIAEKYRL